MTFGEGKRLVLLRGAGPAHLGPVARLLRSLGPARICVRLGELGEAPAGGYALLVLRPSELTAANFARPIFRERDLRAVLFAADESVAAAQQHAPDLMDWISDVVEAPQRVPDFVVASLFQAAAHFPGVCWRGGVTEAHDALAAAFPEAPRTNAPSPRDFTELVDALNALRGWQIVAVEDEADALRLRLALDESRRRGRVLAIGTHVPGWPTIDARVADWSELDQARPPIAGDLAADLDCEPAALERRNASPPPTLDAIAGLSDMPTLRATLTAPERPVLMRTQALRARDALSVGEAGCIDHVAAWADRTRSTPALERLPPRLAAAAMGTYLRRGLRPPQLASYAVSLWWIDLAKRWSPAWPPPTTASRAVPDDDSAANVDGVGLDLRGVLRGVRGLARTGALGDVLALLRSLEGAYRRISPPDTLDLVRLLRARAELLVALGRDGEALDLLDACEDRLAQRIGPDEGLTGLVRGDRGTLAARVRRPDAEETLRSALARQAADFGSDHPHHAATESQLATLLSDLGRDDEADHHHRSAVAAFERSVGPRHRFFANALGQRAASRLRAGHLDEAEALLRRALEVTAGWATEDPLAHARAQHDLGVALVAQGRSAEAERLLRAALDTRTELLGAGHPDRAATLLTLGQAIGYDDAEQGAVLARQAASALAAAHGSEHPTARAADRTARTLAASSDLTEPLARAAVRWQAGDAAGAAEVLLSVVPSIDDPTLGIALRLQLARALAAAGRTEDADAQLTAAATLAESLPHPTFARAEIERVRAGGRRGAMG